MGSGRARNNAEVLENPQESNTQIRISSREPASKAFFCYIVECADGTYYTGWTTDPERRLRVHNRGKGAKYTRNRRPVRLVYVEEQLNRGEAMKREYRIKRMGRKGKEKLIKSMF
jgi:putative endonuclease